MKIKEMADVFLNSADFCDLSFASTETKFIKPKTKTQNNLLVNTKDLSKTCIGKEDV